MFVTVAAERLTQKFSEKMDAAFEEESEESDDDEAEAKTDDVMTQEGVRAGRRRPRWANNLGCSDSEQGCPSSTGFFCFNRLGTALKDSPPDQR